LEAYLDLLNYLPGATSPIFQDLISSSLIGRISRPVLGNVVTGPRYGKNLRAAREQRVTGPRYGKNLRAAREQRVTDPRYGKNLRAAGEQRVTGPHFQLLDWSRFNVPSPVALLRDLVKQKSNGSQRTTRFGTSFSAPLLAGFHVPSRIPLLRDLGTQSLRAAKEQRVTGPHFQLLDWSRFKSCHG
jgi:hypothetical protein